VWPVLGERSTQYPELRTIVLGALGTPAVYRNSCGEGMRFRVLD